MNKRKSGCWEWLLEELKPDYVLAQEASPLPDGVKATTRTTTKKSNRSTFYSKENNHQKVKVKTDNGMGLIVSKAGEIHFICVYANLDFKPFDLLLLGLISSYATNAGFLKPLFWLSLTNSEVSIEFRRSLKSGGYCIFSS